jgi:hypothetical protein
MQKTPPTITCGNFSIKYKQLYDNRYFFIYYNKQEIGKIPTSLLDSMNWGVIFPKYFSEYVELDRMEDFILRVQAHNNYLNNLGD